MVNELDISGPPAAPVYRLGYAVSTTRRSITLTIVQTCVCPARGLTLAAPPVVVPRGGWNVSGNFV